MPSRTHPPAAVPLESSEILFPFPLEDHRDGANLTHWLCVKSGHPIEHDTIKLVMPRFHSDALNKAGRRLVLIPILNEQGAVFNHFSELGTKGTELRIFTEARWKGEVRQALAELVLKWQMTN